MGRGLPIREDVVTASELRGLAKKEPRRRTAQRRLAIAHALEGMSGAHAARGAAVRAREVRGRAGKDPGRRTAQRRLAIANALEGMSRAQAARAAGIERPSR